MKNITALPTVPAVQQLGAAGGQTGGTHDARLKNVAHQFEAMFMTEMIRQARPPNQAAGPFAAGKSEESWSVFMDQALGQAATVNGPAGDGSLRRAIEKALRDADAKSVKGQIE